MKKEIVAGKKVTTKSGLQTQYEKLLQYIEQNKAAQKNLAEGFRAIVPRIHKEIQPLISKRDALFRQRLLRLDELANEISLDKHNRECFEAYMTEQASQLLDRSGFGDRDLLELAKKYAGESGVRSEEQLTLTAQLLQDELGFEVDAEKLMNQGVDNFMREHADKIQQKRSERREAEEAEEMRNFDPSVKKRVNKQEEALKQDAKAIYLRLVKKCHPDREPDEAEKIRKTELIQRVAQAYQENDFLMLLKLQIEYLEEEETDASFLAENMLTRYNKILQKQLDEIKAEIDSLKHSSMGLFEDFFDQHNKFSERKFRSFKKSIREQAEFFQWDLNESKKYEEGWFKDRIKEIKTYQQ